MSAGTLAQQFIDDKREIKQRLKRKIRETTELQHTYFREIEQLILKKMPAGTTCDDLLLWMMGVTKDKKHIDSFDGHVTVIDKSDGFIVYLDNDIAKYFANDPTSLTKVARKMKKHAKMKLTLKALEDKLAAVTWD